MPAHLPRAATDYRPEAIWSARHRFVERGEAPLGLVHGAVLRSWQRCSDSGRQMDEPVEFQPVERSRIASLLEANQALLQAARPELSDLAGAVGSAGYAVLLTDREGNALAVDGAIAQRSAALRMAFRPGVDLSEAAIGTNAMAVAMREAQPARVLGAEHFFSDAQIFHCSAVPVFGVQGEVIGAVDVSRDMPGMVDSTLWLAARCAQRIERRLFLQQPARVRVEIDTGGGITGQAAGSGAWLAFGAHGELVAANAAARSLMGLPPGELAVDFDTLFQERFGHWLAALRDPGQVASMRLRDGVRLLAMPMEPVAGIAASPAGAGQPVPPRAAPPALAALTAAAPAAPRAPAGSDASPEFGDARMAREFARACRAARAGLPVLLTGETGTGKEVAARALHAAGPRAGGPFVAINCAAVPGELLAGELFGHVDGAFTGARRGGAAGKFEAAQGGTLFLDEIGDMPTELQVALLRVLDTRTVVRLGCHQTRPLDIQLVCATHRDLAGRVAQGLFREDLMYRVAGHTLHLLPLRERQDFQAVLDLLLHKAGADPARAGRALREQLQAMPWPGNVRQLQHAVQRALALAEPQAPLCLDDFTAGLAPAAAAAPVPAGLMQQATEQAIAAALRRTGGNVSQAARVLGIGRATLYRRLERQGSRGRGG